MEDNQNEQRSKWKTTKMKDIFPPPKKKIAFQELNFPGNQLSRKADFQESGIPGKLSFPKIVILMTNNFLGKQKFSENNFTGKLVFKKTSFPEKHISRKARFQENQLSRKAYFQESISRKAFPGKHFQES